MHGDLFVNSRCQCHQERLKEESDYGTALHIAARFGHPAVIRVLLSKSATYVACLNTRDKFNYTALGLAVLHVHADVVEELVAHDEIQVNA